MKRFLSENTAETIFDRLEADAAAGELADFSFIEPSITMGHNDYHPAYGRAMGHGVSLPGMDPPSSMLGGEALLARIYRAYRGMRSESGANVWNTNLFIGWDEPGGTYDHVPPPAMPPPDDSPPSEPHGFGFDRSGYRVPAVIVSPWVAEGQVFNDEYRHTSLIATLRQQWDLGEPLTGRDADARTFEGVLTLDRPRDPDTWPDPEPRPVPEFQTDDAALGATLSAIGQDLLTGIEAFAAEQHIDIPELQPGAELPPDELVPVLRRFVGAFFPQLVSEHQAEGRP